ncbi:Coiled-coil protein [Giardia duodenalis]|uniref:Coiled-coil protein n=1 Tax=Giardia intestinalis (strain ATCC 50803 / WB clone C6) TaxID=184922 RepID=A8BAA6_GIAIC|nr:Coiled-coil protein [Giardia intestinalis]KAE8303545.1 Coiled-coil protein [Giardia intestinalis]|eukprot:XP_001708346.1 Coiled-coil protein [Giardia lamblia ATCC 50803]
MPRLPRPPPNPNATLSKTTPQESVLLPGYKTPRVNETSQPLTAADPNTELPAIGNTAASLQAARAQVPASAVEKEFIYNLQQQVYFLELQSKLLRDKLVDAGPKLKSRSVEANPAFDKSLDAALPLQEYIEGLRNAYSELESKYQADSKELKSKYEAAQHDLAAATAEIAYLKKKTEDFPKELARASNQMVAQLQKLNEEREALDAQLKEANLDIDHLRDELAVTKSQLELRTAELADTCREKQILEQQVHDVERNFLSASKAEERERCLAEALADLKKLKADMGYLQTELNDTRASEKKASDMRWEMDRTIEEHKLTISELNSSVKHLREENKLLSNSLSEARRKLEELATKESLSRKKYDELNNESTDLLRDARTQAELHKRQIGEAESRRKFYEAQNLDLLRDKEYLEKTNDSIKSMQELLSRKLDECRAELAASQEAAHTHAASLKTLEQRLAMALEENQMSANQIDGFKRIIERSCAELDLKDREIDAYKALVSIDPEEFMRLQQTNHELALKLNGFNTRFSRLGSDAREFIQSGWKLSRNQELAKASAGFHEIEPGPDSCSPDSFDARAASEKMRTDKDRQGRRTELSMGDQMRQLAADMLQETRGQLGFNSENDQNVEDFRK